MKAKIEKALAEETRYAKEWQQEKDILERKVAEQTADLQLKNRELEIEATLERVRSRSMAMQKSEELAEVVRQINEEIMELGIDINNTQIGTDFTREPHNGFNDWVSVEGQQYLEKFHIPFIDHPVTAKFYETLESDLGCFTAKYSKSEKNAYFKLLFEYSDFKDTPEERKNYILNTPGWVICCVISKNSSMQFARYSLEKFSPEEIEVFKRFGKVFEQAYTRFLDLQKAEEQAREAEIETALERVRSQSLAMQKSDDLHQVINIVSEQLDALEIEFDSANFIEINEDGSWELWVAVSGQEYAPKIHVPYINNPTMNELLEAKNQGVDLFQGVISLENKNDFFTHFFENTAGKNAPEERKQFVFEGEANAISSFTSKSPALTIGNYSNEPFSEEENEIFRRFANVFEQAYTRFLDLQKAETQAREAKIEAALERVRSRSMGMQKSDELIGVVREIGKGIHELGIQLHYSQIYTDYTHDLKTGINIWVDVEGQDYLEKFQLPYIDHSITLNYYNAVNEGLDYFSDRFSKAEKDSYFKLLFKYSDLKRIPPKRKELIFNASGWTRFTVILNEAALNFGRYSLDEFTDEENEIFIRFAKVFGQAYTRFLDLQKAEKQAAEAVKQASLDRVRGEIASMRSAEDLEIITPLIWNELTNLGIPFIRCGVFIIHKDQEVVEIYLSKPDGTSLAVMHLPFGSSDLATQTVDAWQQGDVYKQHWTQEEFLNWGRTMMEQGQVPDLESYKGAEEAPDSLHLHFLPFNQGMLYVGSTDPLTHEEIDLAESLAKAFSIAYARYEDFVKLEKAKAGIEEALTELKATQSQLVQQEKLASLGQLTAGIAHEIKNPLNFVNNFSELSVELIEETKEELSAISDKLSSEDRKQVNEALEILKDVESNLQKIHEHGNRADSIVKSMLEHSRGGSGKMEPTDLNALVKEFVNLSFHGMRAGKDAINVDIQFDLDESIKEVPLIAEDFSRVIINLCNNGFDAMRSKLTEDRGPKTENYSPTLIVRSQSSDKNVIIEIQDNGPGIPEDIKDKILQPFFTTKKGTQGTGLGLSITNDIIKAHGGELEIKSTEGVTIFSITLPYSF